MEAERIWAEAQRLYTEGRLREAAQLFDQLHRRFPAQPMPLYMLGLVAGRQGRHHDALHLLAHAVTIAPDHPAIQADYANALRLTGRADKALPVLELILSRDPGFAPALERRAYIRWSEKRFEEALADFRQALARDPRRPDMLFNIGTLLDELRRTEEALAAYDRAVALDPHHVDARNSRGWARLELGQFDAALADFQQVTRARPNLAGAQMNLGLYWLLMGDFARGLPLFESRLQHAGVVPRTEMRDWRGESLGGKTILVQGEGGLGDVIQFCRLLPLLVKRGADIHLACPAKLRRLLQPLPVTVVDDNLSVRADYRLQLMSLPLACGLRADTIPPPAPLAAEPALALRWRERLGNHGFRIGVVWHGEHNNFAQDRWFPLAALAPLARLPGVRLISLQKGQSTPALDRRPDGMALEVFEDLDTGPDAFVDTAAIMAHCDLVITADTSTAHLAGSLGVPVWTLLKSVPDWRWHLNRPDTSWYPSMRLFRQTRRGDWDSVMAEVQSSLELLLAGR
jgi:Tfp pilus assembly protein PilF